MFAPNCAEFRTPADCIKDVWSYNLHDEFRVIRKIVQTYQWIAMDTEFPGIVVQPLDVDKTSPLYNYQLMSVAMLLCRLPVDNVEDDFFYDVLGCLINVDMLKLIQLGLTFMDDRGRTPAGCCTWQFNFKFNLQKDTFAQDSINLLQRCGIRFRKHATHGIDALEFAELLMTSGLVLMDNVKFLCFHSGYDFGYLLKMLTDVNLPAAEPEFFYFLKVYFPNIYDVKHLMKLCKELHGGLQEVADQLELPRIGVQHQAGSDSLLTGMAFFKIKDLYFDGNIESTNGHVHGLGLSMNKKAIAENASAK